MVTDLTAIANSGHADRLVLNELLCEVRPEVREVRGSSESKNYLLSVIGSSHKALCVCVLVVDLVGDGCSEGRIGAI